MDAFKGATGYADLADRMRSAIRDGQLKPGERLPSQRRLAYHIGLAVGTVTRAYALLERERLADSYVGRGTFVAFPSGFGKGFSLAPKAEEIDLSLDQPLEHLNPPFRDILSGIAVDSGADALMQYLTPALDRRNAEAGVQWTAMYGFEPQLENVVPVLGAQHGLFIALATVCRPGDVVIAEALAYPGLMGAAKMLGLKVEPATIDAQGLVPQAVADICKSQSPKVLYVTPSMQNPTTGQLGQRRREALAFIARKYDVMIIEDELKPRFVVPAPDPIASLAPERTFFIAGLSKVVGGGVRVAFMTIPPGYRTQVDHNIWAASWKVPSLPLEIASRLIETGAAADVATRKEAEAARRRELVDKRLGHFDIRTAEGGTYAWLTLPAGWSNARALAALKENGVAATAADAFWVGHTPPPDALRLCLGVQADAALLDEGLSRVAQTLTDTPQMTRL